MTPTMLTLLVFAIIGGLSFGALMIVLALSRWLFGEKRREEAARVAGPVLRLPSEGPPPEDDIEVTFERFVGDTGLSLGPLEVALLMLACGLGGGGIAFLLSDEPVIGLGALILGLVLPLPILQLRRSSRIRKLRETLPQALELLARAVRAGQSLDQSIALVGDQADEPWNREFSQIARQMEMGLSVQSAVHGMKERTRLPEVQELATVLTVNRQVGGNLPLMLDRLARIARDRQDYYRQFRASTAGGRIATLIMLVFWLLGFAYFFFVDSDYSRRFLGSPQGQILLVTSLTMMGAGLWWINRLLKVSY